MERPREALAGGQPVGPARGRERVLAVEGDEGVEVARGLDGWFLRFVVKLLLGDKDIAALLRNNPFPDEPPKRIRAHIYRYWFTDRAERKATGAWWNRAFVAELLPPVGLTPVRDEREYESVEPDARDLRRPPADADR